LSIEHGRSDDRACSYADLAVGGDLHVELVALVDGSRLVGIKEDGAGPLTINESDGGCGWKQYHYKRSHRNAW